MEFKDENEVLDEAIVKKIRRTLYLVETMNSHKSVPKKDSEMAKRFESEIKKIVQGR